MSGEEPSNALIALSRRLRTVAPKDLPIVDRAVLLTVAGRADADWIAFPPVEWVAREAGTTPNTARRALDRLVKVSGWLGLEAQATARTSARYRIRLEPVPPAGVTERYPSKARGRGDGAAPQGSRCDIPGVTEQHPRGDGAAPADHRKIQSRSQKDPIARPRARAGGQQSLLPDLETSTAKATEPKEPKPAKPPRVKAPKAEDLYAEAYVAGHRDAGFSMTPLSKSERGLLGPIAATHARFRDDSPITGDLLLRWIRERARDFRDFVCEKSGFRSNVSPFGFRAWLDAGHDGAKRWRPPGAEAAPPPEPPRLPNRPPPGLVGSPREALAALEANSYVPRAAVETLRRDIERREALAAQEGQAAHG